MLQSEFIDHLARKGILRDAQPLDGAPSARRREHLDDCDWIALTKLTHASGHIR
jgi:general secretion pathway protein E